MNSASEYRYGTDQIPRKKSFEKLFSAFNFSVKEKHNLLQEVHHNFLLIPQVFLLYNLYYKILLIPYFFWVLSFRFKKLNLSLKEEPAYSYEKHKSMLVQFTCIWKEI